MRLEWTAGVGANPVLVGGDGVMLPKGGLKMPMEYYE